MNINTKLRFLLYCNVKFDIVRDNSRRLLDRRVIVFIVSPSVKFLRQLRNCSKITSLHSPNGLHPHCTILVRTTWANSGERKPDLVVDQDQQYNKITL